MNVRIVVILLQILLLPLAAQGQSGNTSVDRSKEAKAQHAKELELLRAAVAQELSGGLFARCLAAVEIADAESGDILVSRHADLLLRPASNAKLVTTAAAVLRLPADFHFETRIARIDSAGRTLACIGGGDPLFSEQDIQKLAEIAAHSTRTVADTLLMDGTLFGDDFYGEGWMWDDETDPFAPYLGAFSINRNTLTVSVSRSASDPTSPVVRIHPSSAMYTVETASPARDGRGFRVSRGLRRNHILVEGIPPTQRTVHKRFSMWQPQEVFADLLLKELRGLGAAHDSTVIVFSAVRAGAATLGSVRRPLQEVLEAANKNSDNLSAECLLRALAFTGSGRDTQLRAADGLHVMESALRAAGLNTDDFALRDGSGISFYNLLTARGLGRLLRSMAQHPSAPAYLSSLSVGGKDGTLRRRMSGHPVSAVRAKTGTVRGVSALSGYVQAPGGRLLSFVIMMQNFAGKPSPYRDVQDRIVGHCLKYSAAAASVRQLR